MLEFNTSILPERVCLTIKPSALAASINGFDAIYTTDANFYEDSCRQANDDGVMNNTYVRMVYSF